MYFSSKNQISEIAPVWDREAGVWSKDSEAGRREVALYQVICHLVGICILDGIFWILYGGFWTLDGVFWAAYFRF